MFSMEILKDLRIIENSCVGLGFFDGVHLGHTKLINDLCNIANTDNCPSVILTFKNSPAEIFFNNVDYLTSSKERECLINNLGIKYMVELDFDKKLMSMTADDYLREVIYKYFKPRYILCGFNHTFGKEKKGNTKFLWDSKEKYGYNFVEIPPVTYDGEVISSTLIKKYLSEGNIIHANEMLGHKFSISGIVIKGNQIGQKIGFPTANILYPAYKSKIPFGVYCAEVDIEGQCYKGMLNYGIKPTIKSNNDEPIAEVHILGFNNNIYGKKIKISIVNKIRDEQKFNSLEELKLQIKKDLIKC